jgi:hypothetical protein
MLNSLSIENSLIFSIGLIIVIGSIFSTIILKPILYYDEFRASFTTSISFLLVCTTTLISQFILISYITKKLFSMREYKSSIFMYSNFILLFSTVFLTIVLAFVIKDIFINKIYDLFLFQFVILYSIVVAICIQIIVIIKFLQWIIKKRNIILVLYTITHFFLFAILIMILLLISNKIDINSFEVSPSQNPFAKTIIIDPLLQEAYRILFLLTFILIWISTSILLKTYSTNYMKRIGKVKFWILVSLPLIYYIFSSDFVTNNIYNVLVDTFDLTYVSYISLISLTNEIGAIFFALPFLFMSKNISNKDLKFYLLICAIGIMILISSLDFSFFYLYPYPPFGLSTISNIPLSIFLLLVGIIFSARSISYDRKLLSELNIQIKNQPSAFLKGIGSIEWQNNIEKTIKQIKIEKLEEITPSSSLTKEEINNYIKRIIYEMARDN